MITDEMVALAMRIAQGACRVGAGDGNTYVVSPPTMETTRAALAAVLPLIRNAALEEAAAWHDGEARWRRDGLHERTDFHNDCAGAIRALKETPNE